MHVLDAKEGFNFASSSNLSNYNLPEMKLSAQMPEDISTTWHQGGV